jgi:D-arabinose 1-dehydrogenase-like Zn-dependent alcohol dehydrogenase
MVEVFKLSKINEAIARVESGKARYRVVMETDLE